MKTRNLIGVTLVILSVWLMSACTRTTAQSATTPVAVQTIRPFATALPSIPRVRLTAAPTATASSVSTSTATRDLRSEFSTSQARARTQEALRPTGTPTLTKAQLSDLSSRVWLISAHGPIEMRLTDPHGRKLGYRENSTQPYAEIPFGYYGLDHLNNTLSLTVPAPEFGEYQLEIIGKSKGTYDIFANYVDTHYFGSTNFVLDDETEPDQIQTSPFITAQKIIQLQVTPNATPVQVVPELPVLFQVPLDKLEFETKTPAPSQTPDEARFLTSKIECSFGDGNTASDTFEPVHSFKNAGQYLVACITTNVSGKKQTYSAQLVVK